MEPFINLTGPLVSTNGTCLAGYLRDVTEDQISAVFGAPMEGCDKTTREWAVEFVTDWGTSPRSSRKIIVATIYDYKGDRWHIGSQPGWAESAQHLVKMALRRNDPAPAPAEPDEPKDDWMKF